MDVLALFHVMNEGTINVLGTSYSDYKLNATLTKIEHYFEMSHPDAERALRIYRTFCKQTELVVQYLSIARLHEHSTRLEIPKIKHAPTSLAKSLEEYLNDKDFETNRKQYLAQQQAKKDGKATNGTGKFSNTPFSSTNDDVFTPKPAATQAKQEPTKGPAPDLIDFFESIEQNQQPMAQQPNQFPQQQMPQVTGFPMQQTGFQQQPSMQQPFLTGMAQPGNPFGQAQMQQQQQQQLQPNFTGAGFGGYTPQPFHSQSTLSPIPQESVASFPQQQQQPQQMPGFGAPQQTGLLQPQHTSTNPFRQSMLLNTNTGMPGTSPIASPSSTVSRQSTNPFAKPQQQSLNVPSIQAPQPLQSTPTGTNPFARNPSPGNQQQSALSPPPANALVPNPTGSTNPFRQSAFVNQSTGMGWQSGQGTMGGLEHLETVPVFPRLGQNTGAQQGQQGLGQQQTGWQ